MDKLKISFLIAAAALLAGCQTTGGVQGPRGEVQELTVNRPLTMAIGGGGARFQYGDRTTAVNPDAPYCIIRGGARSLEPDSFIITRVERGSSGSNPEDLPSNGGFYEQVRLWLSSPLQPAIQEMICRRPSSLSEGDMSSADIQAILGQGFTLR